MRVITLTKDNFQEVVFNSEVPVVIDFWAPWCGPCKMMAPTIERLAEESDGSYIVCKVNVDEEDELSNKYRIMSIPTIKVFKDGIVTATTLGVTPQDEIKRMIAR